jgi:hypothetical protein
MFQKDRKDSTFEKFFLKKKEKKLLLPFPLFLQNLFLFKKQGGYSQNLLPTPYDHSRHSGALS